MIRQCKRSLERQVEIEAFEEWTEFSDKPVDPRILEKLTRALQEIQ
jgi:hypothetical protein